jgi:glutamyl-tRNA synthetase
VGRHGSKFDPEKAKWFNHQYLQRRPAVELAALLAEEARKYGVVTDQGTALKVVPLIRERLFLLTDLWDQSWFFFRRPESYNSQVIDRIWQPGTAEVVKSFAGELTRVERFDKESLHGLIQEFTAKTGIKTGQLMNPLRLLVVGSNQGPGMTDIAELLGKEEFLGRLSAGLDRLANGNRSGGNNSLPHS